VDAVRLSLAAAAHSSRQRMPVIVIIVIAVVVVVALNLAATTILHALAGAKSRTSSFNGRALLVQLDPQGLSRIEQISRQFDKTNKRLASAQCVIKM
jgi:uncharacterized membrane protein (DUF106 family)